jgi:hypothetical protein
METEQILDQKEAADNNHRRKGTTWTNDEKVELIKLRLQGLTFEEIGRKMGRTKHAARSQYGHIRRGETDVTVSLKDLPELREALPVRKA